MSIYRIEDNTRIVMDCSKLPYFEFYHDVCAVFNKRSELFRGICNVRGDASTVEYLDEMTDIINQLFNAEFDKCLKKHGLSKSH